jgi:hypothetical protein
MRENLTSGLKGGSWKRNSPVGHPRVPSRCAEKPHNGSIGTQPPVPLSPRQLPTRLGIGDVLSLTEDLDKWIRMRLRSKARKRFKSKGGIDHHRFPNRLFDDHGLVRLEHLARAHRLSPA